MDPTLGDMDDEEWMQDGGPALIGVGAETDVAGYHEAFRHLEELWDGTVGRARALDPALLHEQVGGEWSFTETLRHLPFATESWVGRGVLQLPAPWHPLSLPWDQMEDSPGIPRDRAVRPSLDEVLALRADRQALVHRALDQVGDTHLDDVCTIPEGSAWPPPGEQLPVRECFNTVINEEWWHRRFAERDLTVLIEREASS
jgi:hypothetical protein